MLNGRREDYTCYLDAAQLIAHWPILRTMPGRDVRTAWEDRSPRDDGVWTVEGSLTVRGHQAPVRLTIDSLTVRDGPLRLSASAAASITVRASAPPASATRAKTSPGQGS
ncbi:hypothetical protein [Streptomyces sp. NPDC096311]|uniref:hypothetical protein n=1 Tax=Streptomyces sp. NPDC096311 TaxID=3366083 RepID=UPI003806BA2C